MANRYSILEDTELVKQVAKESTSIADMLRTLGLGDKSTDYRKIRAKAEELRMELPKWHNKARMDSIRKAVPNNEVFIKKSNYSNRAGVKKRMVRDLGIPPVCDGCDIGQEWNGKPLTLTLDHINGVGDDNRIENLRLLCPNCHSQTDTFCGRNAEHSSPVYLCGDCGGTKQSKNSQRCRRCAGRTSATKINWPEPEEVLNLVKSDGFEATGREFGVTGNAVRKFLQRNNLL